MKSQLIAFDVDGVLKGYGGPVGPLELEAFKQKYYVGIISARADYKEVAQLYRLDFAYKYGENVFAQIKREYSNLKTYVYVTDDEERFAPAEAAGWTAIKPEAVVGYGDNIMLFSLKVMLAAIMYVANLLDYYTTKKALEKGLKEANPLARGLMKLGWRKYQLAKWLIPVGYSVYAITSDDPYYINTAGLAITSAVFIYAVINNIMLIRGIEA
ncbi:MAG: DUF5658 family protein [Candidatus Bathyarchaeia archaeon]